MRYSPKRLSISIATSIMRRRVPSWDCASVIECLFFRHLS